MGEEEKLTKSGESSKVEEKSKKDKILDTASNVLAAASLIPGLDTFTNLASIPVDLLKGDYKSAVLDALGMIPVLGEGADALKLLGKADMLSDVLKFAGTTAGLTKFADKSADALKIADKATDAVKAVDNAADAIKTTMVSPTNLTRTHKLTMSKKQYLNLLEDIQKNGIREPIKYVDYDRTKYIVDGHHRLQAAKHLNLDKIPVTEVQLPYKGYKTIEDLLWFD